VTEGVQANIICIDVSIYILHGTWVVEHLEMGSRRCVKKMILTFPHLHWVLYRYGEVAVGVSDSFDFIFWKRVYQPTTLEGLFKVFFFCLFFL